VLSRTASLVVANATRLSLVDSQIVLKTEQDRRRDALNDVLLCYPALAEHAMENTTQSSEDQTTRSRSALADKVKQDSRERIERGKQAAADQVEQLADAIDQAGSRLSEGQPTIGSYAARMADGLDQLAHRLRSSSLEDLARDTRQVAIRNPGAYLLGSAAVGLLLARFLKASIEPEADRSLGLSEDFSTDAEVSFGGSSSVDPGAAQTEAGTAREADSTSRGIH
jgi:hypothetical protein